MDVKLALVTLTMSKAELQLLLPRDKQELPIVNLETDDPDAQASMLAFQSSEGANRIQRHGFLSPKETQTGALTLVYSQLLSEEKVLEELFEGANLIPVSEAADRLDSYGVNVVQRVVSELKADLDQVMNSRLNKRGLIHLLGLLPDIFDHKELAAAYHAFTGEKPSSQLMLARMMLDRYTMGSGEKQREVKGRDLIQEYEADATDLLGEKWEKNKDLYRSGGPKAKRLYRKNFVK